MCTGIELAAAAAEAAAASAPVAATAAEIALPTMAALETAAVPTMAAVESGGLGSLLAGGVEGASAIAPEAIGSTAGATLSAAEVAPTSLAAAESSVIPSASSVSFTGPQTGEILPAGLQESGAVTMPVNPAAGAYTPPSTFLGMTPTQWGQQLLMQGASTGLQAIGQMQSANAGQKTADEYNAALSDWEKQQIAAVDAGMTGYTPEAIAANRKKYSEEMMDAYDTSALARPSFGTLLLDSSPEEMKADYSKKQAESSKFARDQFAKSVDLTSLGRAMTSGAQQLQDALTKANMNKSYINSLMSGAGAEVKNAQAGSGQLASGLGTLGSSLGNLMLANQQASGSKPASVLDIR